MTLLARIFVELVRWPFILLWWTARGWRIEQPMPRLDKMIVLGVPHTTNWDYPHMLAAALHERRRPHVTVKKELIRPPFGWFIKAAGGIPIDRSRSTNVSDQLAEWIRGTDRFMLIFTPEGTRRYRPTWRTGFYYTALKANIPIVCGYIDYPRKRMGFGLVIYPTGDIQADFAQIKAFYEVHGHKGLYPENINDLALPANAEDSAPANAEDSAHDRPTRLP